MRVAVEQHNTISDPRGLGARMPRIAMNHLHAIRDAEKWKRLKQQSIDAARKLAKPTDFNIILSAIGKLGYAKKG